MRIQAELLGIEGLHVRRVARIEKVAQGRRPAASFIPSGVQPEAAPSTQKEAQCGCERLTGRQDSRKVRPRPHDLCFSINNPGSLEAR